MESKLFAPFVLILSLALILTGSTVAQALLVRQGDSCTITITVQVTVDGTAAGTPVPGIVAQIRDPAGEILATGTTDGEGCVELVATQPSDTGSADYEVWVEPIPDSDPQWTATMEGLPCPEVRSLVVQLPTAPIGQVQGPVGDVDNGRGHRSPYQDEVVTVQGVVYQKTLARSSSGNPLHGLFIQNTGEIADDDANSSDGIFVFLGGSPAMETEGPEEDLYLPQIGDEVLIRGEVTEFFNLTELTDAALVEVVRSDVDLDAEVPPLDVNPPANFDAAGRYWERREGMRVRVPASAIVLNGRDVFNSTMDAEIWLARGDSTIAQRADAYARRAFRDPHPLDNVPGELFDDANGYRIVLGSLGIKATSGDGTTLITPSRTFDVLENALVGGVYYSFGKYQVQVGEQPVLTPGADPSLNAPPQPIDPRLQYTVATYNVENLYDYRDDPFDGCDFQGDVGCPGVRRPYDYAPASDAVYQDRLQEIAQQIIEDLYSPDLLLIQETEDQDICTVDATGFTCGDTDDADGKPDPLQELAVKIAELGGPAYDAAYDRDGADDRGITAAFLYRSDRVDLLPAWEQHPVLGSQPQIVYRGEALAYNSDVQNPKVLNARLPDDVDRSTGVDGDDVFTRPPQVGLFSIHSSGRPRASFLLYAISNHFSSGPDRRVGQRTEQARYNAAIFSVLRSEPAARVVVGGDLNVFPRPDDPFSDDPSDQLGPLYDQGLTNLYDTLLQETPAGAYTYVYQGQAQTLDHLFVGPKLAVEVGNWGISGGGRVAHINSDWPIAYNDDGPRGASDHDPVVANFRFIWQVYLPLVISRPFPVEPTPGVTLVPAESPTPTSTIHPSITPSATPTPTGTVSPTPSPTNTPTFVTEAPTVTPTITITPTPTATEPSPADGQVSVDGPCSQFDAPGNDNENLNQEWVCFVEDGGVATDMNGWRVEDEANHTYVFPAFTLSAGATVRLHTGAGSDTTTDLYWGSGGAIWNNGGDTVYLFDAGGNLVDEYSY